MGDSSCKTLAAQCYVETRAAITQFLFFFSTSQVGNQISTLENFDFYIEMHNFKMLTTNSNILLYKYNRSVG